MARAHALIKVVKKGRVGLLLGESEIEFRTSLSQGWKGITFDSEWRRMAAGYMFSGITNMKMSGRWEGRGIACKQKASSGDGNRVS